MATTKQQQGTQLEAEERITRGAVEIISKEHLLAQLHTGKKVRVKLGIDPTGTHLHIGHAVLLLKLRDFQELGHTAVLVIGDATGQVGDTSDKDSERPFLSKKEVIQNKKTYLAQIGTILDLKKTEIHHNSQWLKKLSFEELSKQADQFSVADFIARDTVKRRLSAGSRVSLREMLYPLMQGYDSVAVKADIEIGGTDQRFNLLAGRTLQEYYGQQPQDILMMPLLLGTDGKKMSKTAGNTINILDTPNDMYAGVMRVADEHIVQYFELCTRVPKHTVSELLALPPREAKMSLAREIVALYHSEKEALKAEEVFVSVVSNKEVPTDVQEADATEDTTLEDILIREGMAPSKSEIRRLVEGGGLKNAETGEKINDAKMVVSKPLILKVGKKKFLKIVLRFKKKDDK